jgi:hypothetical protein
MKILLNIKLARFFNYLLTVEEGNRVGYNNILNLKWKYDYFIERIVTNIGYSNILIEHTAGWLGNMNTKDSTDLSEEDKYKLHMSGDLWVYGESDNDIEKIKDIIKTIYIYAVSELDNELIFDSSDDYVEWNNKLKVNALPLTFMQLYLENDSLIRLRPKFELDRDLDIGYLTVEEEVDTNRKLIKETIELNIQTEKDDYRRNSLKEFFNS